MQTKGIEELKIIVLEAEINFSNINKLAEALVLNEKCNGCNAPAVAKQEVLIKKACRIVSKTVSILVSASETLLSSSCIIGEEKIKLAKGIRRLVYDIKVFLLVRSHILSSNIADRKVTCECNHHENIEILTDVFISVVDIK